MAARFTIVTNPDETEFYILDNDNDEESEWCGMEEICVFESGGRTYFATLDDDADGGGNMKGGKVYELGPACSTDKEVEEEEEAGDVGDEEGEEG